MTDITAVRPAVLQPQDGEAVWFLGNLVTLKATGAQTRGRVTVVEFVNPPRFAPPLHRHRDEDEMFYILSGSAEFRCDGEVMAAAPGDFVLLPVGLPHTFIVGSDEPLRTLQITSPAGFESFAAAVGQRATQRCLPEPEPVDPAAFAHTAARFGIEILGPPPGGEQS